MAEERILELERRLDVVEARLRHAEDQLEILRLLNSYGPAVDSGSSAAAAAQWVDGGGYEFGDAGGAQRVDAPARLAALYEADFHQGLVRRGSAHLTATPQITVDGDTAIAVGYSFVVARSRHGWSVERAAINRWRLARDPAGWRVQERVNRALDGSAESHALMRTALEGVLDPRSGAD